jgi:hypothetical protein
MGRFVLVHGGWGGGWEWHLVADRLRRRGHEVHHPTLSGLGERRHLARPDTNLETHVADVVGLLELDDLLPRDGESVNDLTPPGFVDHMRRLAVEQGEGWQVPLPFGPDELGHPAEVAQWYLPKLVPHPLACFEQPLRLTGEVDRLPTTYVTCAREDEQSLFRRFGERAQQEGWGFRRVPVGHDAHVIAPDEVAEILDQIASR